MSEQDLIAELPVKWVSPITPLRNMFSALWLHEKER